MNDSPMDIDTDVSMQSIISDISIEQDKSKLLVPADSSTPIVIKKELEAEPSTMVKMREMSNLLQNCKIQYRGRRPILTKETKYVPEKIAPNLRRRYLKAVTIIGILSVIFIVPFYDRYYYNRIVDVDEIYARLKMKVLHQDQQIQDIRSAVIMLNYYNKISVLNLVGSNGVGKTHCANILKRGFKSSQTFEIKIDDYNINLLRLQRYVPYLIIIDNLRNVDLNKLLTFLEHLPNDRAILVVNIFNIQETSDLSTYTFHHELYDELYSKFKLTNYNVQNVKFNFIERDVIKKYFMNMRIQNDDLKTVMQVVDNHDFHNFGFKGFVTKLNLLDNGNLFLP